MLQLVEKVYDQDGVEFYPVKYLLYRFFENIDAYQLCGSTTDLESEKRTLSLQQELQNLLGQLRILLDCFLKIFHIRAEMEPLQCH